MSVQVVKEIIMEGEMEQNSATMQMSQGVGNVRAAKAEE